MTTTLTRTDIHRPSAPEFDPQAYDLQGVFDLNPDPIFGGRENARRVALVNTLVDAGYRFAGHQCSGQCGHCGASIRYAALLSHTASHELIWVGETCLDNRFSRTKAEFDRLRKTAQLQREQHRTLAAYNALCDRYPALAYASYADNIEVGIERDLADLTGQKVWGRDAQHLGTHADDHRLATGTGFHTGTLADIAGKARRYGDVSERQVAFVEKLVGEIEGKVATYRARIAERTSAPKAGAVPTGTGVTVEGVVLGTRWYSNDFGGALKVTVLLDNGSRVWSTLPAQIESVDKDDRIRFVANVEATDEPDFGKARRPRRGEVVSRAA